MKIQVLVRLKPSVLDVQGKAVERGLSALGHEGVSNIRIGKVVEFELEGDTGEDDARARVEKLCGELFVNPIIEDCEVKLDNEVR
ncbi:MAG: phosphoribosylformylglycinamidine synthase subunit PurS [Bdellovibrionales bacterium]|nr:phosphoribosylformylglycinamidine synthase subunit PurS [Bdellovibrionales bacterium]